MTVFERYAPFVQDFIYGASLGEAAVGAGGGGQRSL